MMMEILMIIVNLFSMGISIIIKLSAIPMNAVRNTPLRMRITSEWYSSSNTAGYTPKCAYHDYGQTKDFAVTIVNPTPSNNDLKKTGVKTTTPETAFDVQSTKNGIVFPKMSNTEMWNIQTPATGMLIYNTSEHCLTMNYGTEAQPLWRCLKTRNMN